MIKYNADEEWLEKRLLIATDMTYESMKSNLDISVLSNMFFTLDGVSDENVLKELCLVSDAYVRGEIGIAEARGKLAKFLVSQGYKTDDTINKKPPPGVDPEAWHAAKRITNLASTDRLDLIIKQNAAMTYAIRDYQRGMSPHMKKHFPYWGLLGWNKPCPQHPSLYKKAVLKDDPVWHCIFPPNGLKCECMIRDLDEREIAKKHFDIVTGADIDIPEMDFLFDPATAFMFDSDGFPCVTEIAFE